MMLLESVSTMDFIGTKLADFLTYTGFANVEWANIIMIAVGAFFIWLAIAKDFEPLLLIPIGLGIILGNIPFKDAGLEIGLYEDNSVLNIFYQGVRQGWYPPLVFLGIGAMTDFSALIANPKLMLIGAAAQFGIFAAILIACLMGFDLKDAASIGIIGAADGPTSILVSQVLGSNYMGPIAVAAYSYMALVPIIQPFAIKLVTTKKERCIHMQYNPGDVSRGMRIAFPIAVTIIVGFISPQSVALVGFLMFGNLLRECGVLHSLSQAAQNELANIITLLLGITISFSMRAEQFVNPATLMIMALGLVAFVFDTIGGVLFAKVVNVFLKMAGKPPVNPMIGGCGISAFPMSSRVVQKMAAEAEPGNIILMQAAGTNVSGQVASVIAGGLVISIVTQYL